MIEQIAAMLASILAKKDAGQIGEARQEMDGQSRRTIGLTIEEIKKLSPEAVANLLTAGGALQPVRAVTLAELLLVDADLATEKGEAPVANLVHAFCLLADSIEALNSEDQIVYRARLKLLAEKLGDFRTHPYIGERMSRLGV